MVALMDALGHPERSFAAVHVAGTNGKGSVSAIMASVLKEAGFCKVGLYTSPHLVSFNERIRIDGVPVADDDLAAALDKVEAAARDVAAACGEVPTFFECATAAAFEVFRALGVKLAVVETGLGGRLDATNVVMPAVSVITTIGLEHCQYLGSTIREIAREKAGIIKPGRPVVLGATIQGEACEEIEKVADEAGAPLFTAGATVSMRGGKVSFETDERTVSSVSFPLRGAYQADNLATAVTALEVFSSASGLPIPDEAFRVGVSRVFWPCRFDVISESPLVIVDGAHNPPATEAFAASLKKFAPKRPLALVAGFCADKDYAQCLRILHPLFRVAFPTETPSERSLPCQDLEAAMKSAGFRTMPPSQDWRAAYAKALAWANEEGGGVVVLGSLFLAGAVCLSGASGGSASHIPSERL